METSAVYRVLSRRFEKADVEDIEDAVAVANVATWEAREKGVELRSDEAFKTVVAKRALIRSMTIQKRLVHPDQNEFVDWDAIFKREGISTGEVDPAIAIDAHDIIDNAPINYSEVLRAHYLHGLTFEEAALELGVSAECLRKRHERALKWARNHFR